MLRSCYLGGFGLALTHVPLGFYKESCGRDREGGVHLSLLERPRAAVYPGKVKRIRIDKIYDPLRGSTPRWIPLLDILANMPLFTSLSLILGTVLFSSSVDGRPSLAQSVVIRNNHPLVYYHGRWDMSPGTWW